MARFHFFTDISLFQNSGIQPASKAFGPIVSGDSDYVSGKDSFRLTSLHTSSSDLTAFAVCNGVVFVQEQSGGLLNIILKPTDNPPFNFPKVKFYIYRGVKKSSLINGGIVASSTNDLTTDLWDSNAAKVAITGVAEDVPTEALDLGINSAGTSSDILESAFHDSTTDYQLPLVKSGWSIGTFDSTEYGFEIVLDSIGFEPTMAHARVSTTIVSVDTLVSSPTQSQEFEHWHDKEQIRFYIDPAAFFGNFYYDKLKVKSGGSTSTKKKNEIYDLILSGKFNNHDITWLDIRQNNNFSFNYFKNYGPNIQAAYDASSSLVNRDYYGLGWPLMKISTSDFASGNNGKYNTIRLSLPDGSGDNPAPLIFLSSGTLSSNFPRETKDANRMLELNVTAGQSDEVTLASPNRDGQSTTTPIAQYIRLKYCKRYDSANPPTTSSGTVHRSQYHLDIVFRPNEMTTLFNSSTGVETRVYEEEIFIEIPEDDLSFIGKIVLSNDGSYSTLGVIPVIVKTAEKLKKDSLSLASEQSSLPDFPNLIQEKFNELTVRKSNFKLSGTNVSYIDLIDDSYSFDDSIFEADTQGIIFIGFSNTDFTNIDQSTLESKYPVFVTASNLVNGNDDIGQPYTSFDLSLAGYTESAGILSVQSIVSSIKIYFHES